MRLGVVDVGETTAQGLIGVEILAIQRRHGQVHQPEFEVALVAPKHLGAQHRRREAGGPVQALLQDGYGVVLV